MPMRVPFSSFAPDRPPLGNQGATIARNVIPHVGGFRPFKGLTTYSSALTARCQGAAFTTDSDGNVFGFAGDATTLYKLSGGSTTWADVSRVAGYTTPASGRWSSAKFGDTVLMTNYADEIQEFTIGTSSLFANLAGSPPKAKYLAVIGSFVMAGFINDGTIYPSGVRWSAFEDHTNWPTPGTDAARIVQSDQQVLQGDGGWVQGLAGGLSAANGAILQERALWRVIYVQPPIVFQFDQVEGGRGTPAPGSIAQVGGTIFYLGEDGFYRFDGQSSVPIGAERIDQAFFDAVDASYYDRVTAAVDPVNKLVIWAYPSTAATDGVPDRQLIYNWQLNEWTEGNAEVEILARSMTFGVDLDTDLNASETGADDDSWPVLDSRFWSGGRPGLAGFDSSHQLGFFAGQNLAATVETGEFELATGHASLVNRLRPLIDTNGSAPVITARVRSRYRLGDVPVDGQAYLMSPSGQCYARSRGRYHRVKVEIGAGDWEFAQGVDVNGAVMEGS